MAILAPVHIILMLVDLIFRSVNGLAGNVPLAGNAPGAQEGAMVGLFLGGTVDVIAIVCQIVVLVGAIQMMRLQSRQMAYAACVISCIPCLSGCCVLGIPLGIWGLVVLNDEHVKRSFIS